MKSNPLVSIIINNYNYGRYIQEAIESALNQTYKNIEVIIVDDGSTDNSRNVIESYGKRVRAILKENEGQASTFNVGFDNSNGDIICLLDSDDVFLPEKVETIVREFQKNIGYDWLIHEMNHINNKGEEVTVKERNSTANFLKESGDYRVQAKNGRFNLILPATSAIAFRRALIDRIKPVPFKLRITADNYLKLASIMYSPIIYCDKYLSSQRIHGENLYTNQDRGSHEFRKRFRDIHYNIAKGLNALDGKEKQSEKLLLTNIKSSIKDIDISDFTKSVLLIIKIRIGRFI